MTACFILKKFYRPLALLYAQHYTDDVTVAAASALLPLLFCSWFSWRILGTILLLLLRFLGLRLRQLLLRLLLLLLRLNSLWHLLLHRWHFSLSFLLLLLLMLFDC
jgi:hypothetical protein